MVAVRSSASEPVVSRLMTCESMGKLSSTASSHTASAPAAVPLAPAWRTVIKLLRRQRDEPPVPEQDASVVPPSFSRNVTPGPLGAGSRIVPHASSDRTLPAARAPAGNVTALDSSDDSPLVDQLVTVLVFT